MDNGKSLRRMLLVPMLLLLASAVAEISNCHHAQMAIREDLNDTIMILAQQDDQIARQDTLRRLEQIHYAMAQPLVMMADQRMPGTLFVLSVMSALGMAIYNKRSREKVCTLPQPVAAGELRLTPMQRQLVDMLAAAPNHCVSKREICQALWGGKDNADESLYTLVRRTKQTLRDSGMEIICHRGESYQLMTNA